MRSTESSGVNHDGPSGCPVVNLVGLSPSERQAVEALIDRCSRHDGFDPGLHFDTHLNADQSMPAWRLAWARAKETPDPLGTAAEPASTLIGAACVFAPSLQEGEITAMRRAAL